MGPVPTGITLSLTRETGQHQFGFDNDISITLSLRFQRVYLEFIFVDKQYLYTWENRCGQLKII